MKNTPGMGDIEKIAWRWKTINTILDRGEALLSKRYIRIRYEDMFLRNNEGLRQIADWLNLSPEPLHSLKTKNNKIHASQERELAHWQEWNPQLLYDIKHHCDPLMKKYGYVFENIN